MVRKYGVFRPPELIRPQTVPYIPGLVAVISGNRKKREPIAPVLLLDSEGYAIQDSDGFAISVKG